jgi:hypothetical protein
MKLILFIIAGPLFLISAAVHIYVKIKMKRDADAKDDEIYYEFEDEHPVIKRYNKWSSLTFAAACAAALLLFLASVL